MTTKTKEEPATAIAAAPKKRGTGSRRKAGQKAKPAENETKNEEIAASDKPSEVPTETPAPAMAESVQEEVKAPAAKGRKGKATSRTKKSAEHPKEEPSEPKQAEAKPEERDTPVQQRPAKPREISANIEVEDFCDLVNQGARIPLLSDQQIQQLTLEEASMRCEILERILCKVLNYDIVLSDTNIWLELQVGHSSSHSDPKVNARLQFERQLESISKMMKRIGGKFMIMSETYEEVDRFASVLDPVSYKDADWTDEVLCRNVAARLAKRLMLAQQKENRLRIEGIGSESHHSAFADPAIIRRTVELFAQGRKVLLLTNDASVGIRSLGMCDDLQRYNSIDDATWRSVYEPCRPMVLTMDDLKVLDQYSRQYYFLQMASGRTWMQDASQRVPVELDKPLQLWLDGFRPGDRHERRSDKAEQQRKEQQRKEQQRQEQAQREAERKAEQERKEQERREQQRKADRERAARAKAEAMAAKEASSKEPAAEATAPEPQPEQPVQPVAAPEGTQASEEKPKVTRRGGRGRRSSKAKTAES